MKSASLNGIPNFNPDIGRCPEMGKNRLLLIWNIEKKNAQEENLVMFWYNELPQMEYVLCLYITNSNT